MNKNPTMKKASKNISKIFNPKPKRKTKNEIAIEKSEKTRRSIFE